MSYVVAALFLAGACVLSYLVQRWAGTTEEPACEEAEADCDGCALRPDAASPVRAIAPAGGDPPAASGPGRAPAR